MGRFQRFPGCAVFPLDGLQIRCLLQDLAAVRTLGDIFHLSGKRFFYHGQRLAAGWTDPRFLKDLFSDLLQNDERSSGNQKEQREQPRSVGGDHPNHHSSEAHSRQDQKAASHPGGLLRCGKIGFISLLHSGVLEVQQKGLQQLIEVIRIVYVPAGELVVQLPIYIQLYALPVHLHLTVEPGHGQAVS